MSDLQFIFYTLFGLGLISLAIFLFSNENPNKKGGVIASLFILFLAMVFRKLFL